MADPPLVEHLEFHVVMAQKVAPIYERMYQVLEDQVRHLGAGPARDIALQRLQESKKWTQRALSDAGVST